MMKKLLFYIFIFINFCAFGQNTSIPDANFEQALINLGYDSTLDGLVLTANIINVDTLDVSFKIIYDLTGIEDFNSLEFLNCSNNQLTSLNITQNTSLKELVCWANQISVLDVTQNNQLIKLYCFWNQLLNLDISQNPLLSELICWQNQLSILDISQNPLLTILECFTNQITTLNVSQHPLLTTLTCNNNLLTSLNVKNGNNSNFTLFGATNNPNLSCIQVDDSSYSATNWTNIDAQHFFSENCSVGVGELSANTEVSIYPNPATTQLTINVSEKLLKENLQLKLIAVNGQIIKTQQISDKTNTIDVSVLSKGFYTLFIETNGTIFATKKLIISH